MSDRRPRSVATRVGEVLDRYLSRLGVSGRVAQASVVADWPRLVGDRIAKVSTPESVTQDGTLFVRVASSAWVQELQLITPDILRRLNESGKTIRRIFWRTA